MRMISNFIKLREIFNVKDIVTDFQYISDSNFKTKINQYLLDNKIKSFNDLYNIYDNNQLFLTDDNIFNNNLTLLLSGKGYFDTRDSNTIYFYIYIKSHFFVLDFVQRTTYTKDIEYIEISFDSINTFDDIEHRRYERIEKFSSDQDNINKLFSFILYVGKLQFDEGTIFGFNSKLEKDEMKKENELSALQEYCNFMFYILTSNNSQNMNNNIFTSYKYVNYILSLETLPEKIYSEYLEDYKKELLDKITESNDVKLISGMTINPKQFITDFFDTIINKKFPSFFENPEKVKLIQSLYKKNPKFEELLSDTSLDLLDKYMSKIRYNHLRNRMYRVLLRQFGFVNPKFENSVILFSTRWENK